MALWRKQPDEAWALEGVGVNPDPLNANDVLEAVRGTFPLGPAGLPADQVGMWESGDGVVLYLHSNVQWHEEHVPEGVAWRGPTPGVAVPGAVGGRTVHEAAVALLRQEAPDHPLLDQLAQVAALFAAPPGVAS